MPIGVIVNALAVAAGGLTGALAGSRLESRIKESLNMVFGLCSICMGIASVALMKNMPAVVFAIICGTLAGLLLHLGDWIRKGAGAMMKLTGTGSSGDSEKQNMLLTVTVLFCASGTGIYGSLVSGMTGDHSILLTKSILDFFTAMIFACTIGASVSLIAIAQFIVFLTLYLLAGVIGPLANPTMISDFKACGGFIMVATGFRILGLSMFPTADMIPAMILVMPFSWLWTSLLG